MSEMRYWLWLSSLTGVRAGSKTRLLEHFGSVRELYFSRQEEL